MTAKTGMDIAFGAIFVLAIGLTVANDTATNLTAGNATTNPNRLTGTSATVIGYVPLIIVAGFLYIVARLAGIL